MSPPALLCYHDRWSECDRPGDWSWIYIKDDKKGVLLNCPFCGGGASMSHYPVSNLEPTHLTLEGSILCPRCDAHFYIQDGKVVQ